MTVTTLPIGPPHVRRTHPPRPTIRRGLTRRRTRSHADNAPTLTLTFELTLSGDTPTPTRPRCSTPCAR
jgi:hypothetical protein